MEITKTIGTVKKCTRTERDFFAEFYICNEIYPYFTLCPDSLFFLHFLSLTNVFKLFIIWA